MEVLIGVDPHGKSVNAVAAIDEYGEMVGNEVFPANRNGLRALERWAKRFPERRWAVEGAGGIGRPVAQKLVASGESVVDVAPKLSSKTRLLSTGNARKNDRLDATFTAQAAAGSGNLARVSPEDATDGRAEVLRLLTERREDLVAERTRALNRLCMCCCEISSPVALRRDSLLRVPPSFSGELGRDTPQEEPASGWPQSWCAHVAPSTGGSSAGGSSAWGRADPGGGGGLRHHPHRGLGRGAGASGEDRRDRGRRRPVPEQGALRILRWCRPHRGLQRGGVVRHRVSLAGNRRLNKVMHMIAVCQARSDSRGGAYYRKKLAEGKSRREAMRCLKRRISDAVFKALVADSECASQAVT